MQNRLKKYFSQISVNFYSLMKAIFLKMTYQMKTGKFS